MISPTDRGTGITVRIHGTAVDRDIAAGALSTATDTGYGLSHRNRDYTAVDHGSTTGSVESTTDTGTSGLSGTGGGDFTAVDGDDTGDLSFTAATDPGRRHSCCGLGSRVESAHLSYNICLTVDGELFPAVYRNTARSRERLVVT